jgi:hypothetical protein
MATKRNRKTAGEGTTPPVNRLDAVGFEIGTARSVLRQLEAVPPHMRTDIQRQAIREMRRLLIVKRQELKDLQMVLPL